MTSSPRGPATIGAVTAAVLVVTGAALWLTNPGGSASFGWFAYAPLATDVFTFPYMLSGQRLLAAALVVVGLIIAGVAVGFRWGRRVGRVETHPGPDPFSHPEGE